MQVKLVRSPNKRTPKQRRNLQALGLIRINQIRNHADDPMVWGKINKVKHLVEVKR